jgi:hypothetical protein
MKDLPGMEYLQRVWAPVFDTSGMVSWFPENSGWAPAFAGESLP